MISKRFNLLVAVSILFTTWSVAQNKTFSFNEVYSVSDSPQLTISTNDGDVEVFPSTKNEIEVFYIVERNNEVLKISPKELEEEFIVEIASGRDYLNISVRDRYQYRVRDWKNRLNVSFEIYTPMKTSGDIQTSDGNIRITGLNADQKLHTSDGDVEVTKINGDVNARTSDGDITIERIVGDVESVTSDGDIKIRNVEGRVDGRTSDGDVDVVDIKGSIDLVTSDGDVNAEAVVGDIDLTSSDGDLRVDLSEGRMILNTSDGDISFKNISGEMKARTSDGEIKGNVIKLTGDLELRTSDGNITVSVPGDMGLDLVLRGESIKTMLDNFSGTSKDHLVEGEIKGGGNLVQLHASDGHVILSYN